MRKYLIIISIIFLFILDWLALDDITTGNEPDFTNEYIIHAVASVVGGYLIIRKIYVFLYNFQRKIVKSISPVKYHIHHDLVGLLMISLAFLISPLWIQITVAGIGFGLIIHHAQSEGFKFVTKY